MATRNIQMQYYNGSSYDILYPETSYSNLTGTMSTSNLPTIPVEKGGTGATNYGNAIYNLISNASSYSTISDNDWFAMTHSGVGRKITWANIKKNISGLKVTTILDTALNLEYESYVSLGIDVNSLKEYFLLVCTGTCQDDQTNFSATLAGLLTSNPGTNERVFLDNYYILLGVWFSMGYTYENIHINEIGKDGFDTISREIQNCNLSLINKCFNDDVITHFTIYGVSI